MSEICCENMLKFMVWIFLHFFFTKLSAWFVNRATFKDSRALHVALRLFWALLYMWIVSCVKRVLLAMLIFWDLLYIWIVSCVKRVLLAMLVFWALLYMWIVSCVKRVLLAMLILPGYVREIYFEKKSSSTGWNKI